MMSKKKRELANYCKEFDLDEERVAVKKLEYNAIRGLQNIKQEALQWLQEVRTTQEKKNEEEKSRAPPLMPRTPTMKRKLRKRKLPAVDDPERENTAITRAPRAASQAANNKIHQQMKWPLKVRRPSDPKVTVYCGEPSVPEKKSQEKAKRTRVQMQSSDTDYDDDDDPSRVPAKVSVASSTASTSLRNRKAVKIAVDSDVAASEPPSARVSAASTLSIASTTTEKGTRMPRKGAAKKKEEQPPLEAEGTSGGEQNVEGALKKRQRIKTSKAIEFEKSKKTKATKENENPVISEDEQSNVPAKDVEESIAPKRVLKVSLTPLQLPNSTTNFGTVLVTPMGSLHPYKDAVSQHIENGKDTVDATTDNHKSPLEPKVAKAKETEVKSTRKSSRTGKQAVPTDTSQKELAALTPHLKGIVRERVEAVEKSLKKTDKNVPTAAAEKQKTQKLDASSDMFESAESSLDEAELSPMQLTAIRSVRTQKPTSTMEKVPKVALPSTSTNPLAMKLFDSNPQRKRSRSLEDISMVASTRLAGEFNYGTHGRSRVLVGLSTFLKPSVKENAAELERKRKAEEAQKNRERIDEASKKKEEQLRLKKEQKKRENEEKRARAVMAQEARQREQEELARIEREREERKAATQRAREEKELAEKELRKEQRKQKAAEREQRRKEEEAARMAKAQEIADAAVAEGIRRREEEKRAAEAAKLKQQMASKLPHPVQKQQPLNKPALNTLNETFELPPKPAVPTKAPAAAATVAKPANKTLQQASNSYVMTPSKDERPPLAPKNVDDYGIDEINEDDSSDDDEKPKKKVPAWARNIQNNINIQAADYISIGLRNRLFGTRSFTPSAEELFGAQARKVTRRSSAVWNTPPNMHHQSMCDSFVA